MEILINTLLENYEKIKTNDYQTELHMYIIQSSSIISDHIIIKDLIWLFPVKNVKTENLKEKTSFKEVSYSVTKKVTIKEFINRIKFLQQYESNQNINYYILIAKVIDLFDDKIKKHTIGIDPFRIVSDFLHILSLYFIKFFITFPKDHIILSEESCKKNFADIIEYNKSANKKVLDIQKNITDNLNIMCNLRMEQFLFLFKGLSNFNYSLLISENNISVAFSLLITVIETYASKYSNAKENWDDYKNDSFYVGLKKILQDSTINETLYKDIFDKIGNFYIRNTFQSLAKFKDFILKFIGKGFLSFEDPHNSKFKKDLSEYYNLRSKYLHAGKEFPTGDKKTDMIYNLVKSDGKVKRKLKTFSDQHHLDLKKLLPYNWFIDMAKSCIINFINYLKINRDDERDKMLYSEIDKEPRGQIRVTISKPKRPMEPIYEGDFYIKEQYADLYKRNRIIKKFEDERNYKSLVDELKRILNIIEKSDDSLKLGIVYNLLAVNLSHLGEIDDAIESAKKSLKIIKPLEYKELIAEINYNLACFYCLKGNKHLFLDYFRKAIEDNDEYSIYLKRFALEDPQLEGCCKNPDFLKLLKEKE